MARLHALVLAGALCAPIAAPALSAENSDALMEQFFARWDDDSQVTLATVRSLYGSHVVYYGQAMTPEQVFANKQAFIRRWPDRHYSVVTGTLAKRCNEAKSQCSLSVTLVYAARSAARAASANGYTRVSVDLVREQGNLKIVREAGRRVPAPRAIDLSAAQ